MNDIALSDCLLIELQCQRVILEYAELLDAGDSAGLGRLFAENALFARPSDPNNAIHGRDAIFAQFQSRPPRNARHMVSNVLVTAHSHERATATSIIALYTGHPPPSSEIDTILLGTFHDVLEPRDGAWKFVERRGALLFGGRLPERSAL